ncbi:hypothetical protein J1N35_036248 [Gossypium stocksii]|uniref:Uncharacterized protein n=1 Tax=Gossypium stocksii TaxID=47602 RepID=A0A9D3UJS2_9ROSI|nr:hypothetical protein J1N35_036248 [Gossypium stocksii]
MACMNTAASTTFRTLDKTPWVLKCSNIGSIRRGKVKSTGLEGQRGRKHAILV